MLSMGVVCPPQTGAVPPSEAPPAPPYPPVMSLNRVQIMKVEDPKMIMVRKFVVWSVLINPVENTMDNSHVKVVRAFSSDQFDEI